MQSLKSVYYEKSKKKKKKHGLREDNRNIGKINHEMGIQYFAFLVHGERGIPQLGVPSE